MAEERPIQQEIIAQLHRESERHGDGWVCGNDYRRKYIFNSWKRRGEMSTSHKDFEQRFAHYGIERFEDRKCEHDSKGVKDYKIVKTRDFVAEFIAKNPPRNTKVQGFVDIRKTLGI